MCAIDGSFCLHNLPCPSLQYWRNIEAKDKVSYANTRIQGPSTPPILQLLLLFISSTITTTTTTTTTTTSYTTTSTTTTTTTSTTNTNTSTTTITSTTTTTTTRSESWLESHYHLPYIRSSKVTRTLHSQTLKDT